MAESSYQDIIVKDGIRLSNLFNTIIKDNFDPNFYVGGGYDMNNYG
jgi:hypothetical protein